MDGKLPQRKPLRLSGYDYSGQGVYFLTVCTADKRCLLGQVVGGGVLDAPWVRLMPTGSVVEAQLLAYTAVHPEIALEKYVLMPNHMHLLVQVGPSGTPAPTGAHANQSIPALISTCKRLTNNSCGAKLWQRGYYDHIIRDEANYLRILKYIDENPAKWSEDCYYIEKE